MLAIEVPSCNKLVNQRNENHFTQQQLCYRLLLQVKRKAKSIGTLTMRLHLQLVMQNNTSGEAAAGTEYRHTDNVLHAVYVQGLCRV